MGQALVDHMEELKKMLNNIDDHIVEIPREANDGTNDSKNGNRSDRLRDEKIEALEKELKKDLESFEKAETKKKQLETKMTLEYSSRRKQLSPQAVTTTIEYVPVPSLSTLI